MPIGAYKDFCVDVADSRVAGEFWARVLDWRLELLDDGDACLLDASGRAQAWLNVVPEPKSVKNRIHIDVNAASVEEVVAAGATIDDADSFRWTTMTDPEGQEFCVFVREQPIAKRPYELVWDSPVGSQVSHDIATWWQGVVGGEVVDHESGYSWLHEIPSCVWDSFDFGGVPEPKTAKNRVHIDVNADVDQLLAHGATVLTPAGAQAYWTVMADPLGNEFCAFAPE